MELRDLRTFAAVARLLSFHRAAAELNAAQSTVSARIAALETELGVRLFERLGRRVALTEAGERLVQYAAKLIDVEDEARAWVTGESRLRGLLTVRVPESLCAYRLPPVIAAFRRRHPEVALHLTACTLNGLEKDLRQGITDLAFVMADSVRGGDLNVEALGMEPLVLVAAPHHPLATRERITARDLHGVTLVLSTADCAYRTVIEEALAAEGMQPAAGLEFSSAAALRGCVASGVGITLLPEAAVRDELRAGTLRALAWVDQPFETAVLMVRHRGKWVSPYMDTFMELCRAACADAAGAESRPEPVWDFPCPMADVATILEPPKSIPGTDKKPEINGQPSVTSALAPSAAPSVPHTPDMPDAPDAERHVAPDETPQDMLPDEPDDAPDDTPDAGSDDGHPHFLTQVSHDNAPGHLADLAVSPPADETDRHPDEHPDEHPGEHLADEPASLLQGQPDTNAMSQSSQRSDPWPEARFMDDGDTGPETVWGNPPDMTPKMDDAMEPEMEPEMDPDALLALMPEAAAGISPMASAEMPPETFTDLPWADPDDCSDLALADAPCFSLGYDALNHDGEAAPGDGKDMPRHDPEPPSPARAGTEKAQHAAPLAADTAPETRQPSLWDMPEPHVQPPVASAPASQAAGAEQSDAPPASREQAQPAPQDTTPQTPARPASAAPTERSPEAAPEAPQWLSLLPPKR